MFASPRGEEWHADEGQDELHAREECEKVERECKVATYTLYRRGRIHREMVNQCCGIPGPVRGTDLTARVVTSNLGGVEHVELPEANEGAAEEEGEDRRVEAV